MDYNKPIRYKNENMILRITYLHSKFWLIRRVHKFSGNLLKSSKL